MNILKYESVSLINDELLILDQTKLPCEINILHLTKLEDIWQAIYKLQVRGAPAIGIAAAFGLYLESLKIDTDNYDEFVKEFKAAKEYLNSARPTAVNLSWALNRMEQISLNNSNRKISEIKTLLKAEAEKIKSEDAEMCRKIG